jgi:hypothetical protein
MTYSVNSLQHLYRMQMRSASNGLLRRIVAVWEHHGAYRPIGSQDSTRRKASSSMPAGGKLAHGCDMPSSAKVSRHFDLGVLSSGIPTIALQRLQHIVIPAAAAASQRAAGARPASASRLSRRVPQGGPASYRPLPA